MGSPYTYEGLLVDCKPDNRHGSMIVAASTALLGGRIVKDNGSGALIYAGATDYGVAGVLNNDVDNSAVAAVTSRPTAYTWFGWVRLVASGAISAGAQIACDANGKVAALGAGAANLKIGRAITAAANDGDVIEAFINVI